MPSVTLIKPVTHDGEKLVAGDVIHDLTDKAARRLVELDVAIMGENKRVNAGAAPASDSSANLSPEEIAEIKSMKKQELIAALTEAGVGCIPTETVEQLRAKLMIAWAAPGEDAPENTGA